MKCPKCGGTGNINYIQCPMCDGFGQINSQTNEEWFDTLSTTEEKAEAIYECVMANSWSFNKDGIKRWLKQPRQKE